MRNPALGLAALGVLISLALAAGTSLAGGLYAGTKGARSSGRGGAFVARADDLTATVINPAGLAFQPGLNLQVGNRFTYHMHEFTRAPTADTDNGGAIQTFAPARNQAPWQLLDPLLAVSKDFLGGDLVVAVSALAPPGVGRAEYSPEGGQRYMMIERNAMLLSYNLSAAYKVSNKLAFGATFQWVAVPQLDYSLIIDGNVMAGQVHSVASTFDMRVDVSGSDMFTPQAILGVRYEPVDNVQIGLAAQVVPTHIETDSTIEIHPVNPERVGGDEVILTRGDQFGELADDVGLKIPLPLTARAGIRYVGESTTGHDWDVELNGTYESWSSTESFTLDGHGLVATLAGQPLPLGIIEVEKHWQDTFGASLGGDYTLVPQVLVARGGAFIETGAAPAAYTSIDFAAGTQFGGALGFSLLLGTSLELAGSYVYSQQLDVDLSEADARGYQQVPGSQCVAPYTDPAVCGIPGQPAPVVNAGKYRAFTHSASLGLRYQFF